MQGLAQIAMWLAVLWLGFGASDGAGAQTRPNERRKPPSSALLHTEAARNPSSDAHLDAYLATLPRWRMRDGARWRTYYVYGDTLMSRDEVRRQVLLASDVLRYDPCESGLDAKGQITTELDACLSRHPYVSPDGRAKYYIFHLIPAEVKQLAAEAPELLARNRRAGVSPTPSDPAAGLETLPPPATRTYVVKARCDNRDDCAEVISLLKGTGRALNRIKPKLAIHASGGVPMFWSEDYRRIRYAVMRTSFRTWRDYQAAVTAIREAASDWMQACPECGVIFEHAADLDGMIYFSEFLERARRDRLKQEGGLRFVVNYSAVANNLLALAFFPDTPANRRILFVTPAFLRLPTPDAMRSVMRHELGHVLGYRHEHIRLFTNGQTMVDNCYAEDAMVEGQDWQGVTKYDPLSVMHYNCKSAGLPKLTLSPWDIQGHREIYGPKAVANGPAPASPASQPAGGDGAAMKAPPRTQSP